MKQIPLPIVLPPAEGFDSLVVGANAQAIAHLRATAQSPHAGPPIYLWGAEGTGKTRLLQALAAERLAHGERAGWFGPQAAPPWAFDPGWTLVVVDDCDALDSAAQQAAFTLFVEAGSHGLQWAAAGRVPPVDLPLRDDLRSRLGWGLVFALQPLAEADCRAALRREADRRGIWLSDEVIAYVLTRFERNIARLMALLDRLDEFALAEHRQVTVPLLKQMLNTPAQQAPPCNNPPR